MYTSDDVSRVVTAMKLPFEPVPLQLFDSLAAANEGRYAFFYEVGGGKTLVSTIVSLLWNQPHNIVICPPILLMQWQEWLKSAGETSVEVYANYVTDPKFRRNAGQFTAKWVIMSHAIFRDDFAMVEAFYRKRKICLIVDEAQALKNPKSKLYRNVNALIVPDKPLILCTATPTSKPEDSFAFMRLKSPGVYRSMAHWENMHVGSRDFWKRIETYKNLELLAQNFALASAKRTKLDLFGNTMKPIYQPMYYPLTPKHQALYKRLAEEKLLELPDGNKVDGTQSHRLRHMLQQIVVHMAKFSGVETDKSAALELLDEVIEQVDPMNGRSKLAVWTYYQSSSELVTKYLKEKLGDEAVVAAYGKSDSQHAVREIMNNPKCRVLVAQPQSAGAGLNLQHVCSEMLFLEMDTTPMRVRQAIGRVDRMGQTVVPTIRFALAKGTVQLALYKQLLKNDDLVTQVEGTKTTLRQEIFGEV